MGFRVTGKGYELDSGTVISRQEMAAILKQSDAYREAAKMRELTGLPVPKEMNETVLKYGEDISKDNDIVQIERKLAKKLYGMCWAEKIKDREWFGYLLTGTTGAEKLVYKDGENCYSLSIEKGKAYLTEPENGFPIPDIPTVKSLDRKFSTYLGDSRVVPYSVRFNDDALEILI